MNSESLRVYPKVIGFRASDDLQARLARFSMILGRRQSDVIRYLLTSCLSAYETDRDAVARIRQEFH